MEQMTKGRIIMLETRIGIYPTPVSSIIAIEKTPQNGLTIYTREYILTEVNSTLNQMKSVCSNNFIYLSRQCMINKTAISHVIPKSREIYIKIMNNDQKKFICSRNKFRELIKWLESIASTNRPNL